MAERKEKMEKRQQMSLLSHQSKALNPQADNMADGEPSPIYNFKLHLQRPNPAFPDEFFCLSVDEAVARDVETLNQEILKVIPGIKKRIFTLKWIDSEGIERTIPDTETLVTALNEMEGPIYK